eukprot:362012-Chlamydomonas_euryale.AAC.1
MVRRGDGAYRHGVSSVSSVRQKLCAGPLAEETTSSPLKRFGLACSIVARESGSSQLSMASSTYPTLSTSFDRPTQAQYDPNQCRSPEKVSRWMGAAKEREVKLALEAMAALVGMEVGWEAEGSAIVGQVADLAGDVVADSIQGCEVLPVVLAVSLAYPSLDSLGTMGSRASLDNLASGATEAVAAVEVAVALETD